MNVVINAFMRSYLEVFRIVASGKRIYNEMVHKRERNIWHVLISLTGISVLGWITGNVEPTTGTIILFFVLLSGASYTISLFLLNNVRRSVLLTAGVVGFFLLQLLHLRHALYGLLLVSCLISLELTFRKR